jgi:hypothetical protein
MEKIHFYLEQLQAVITRMAGNSAHCKTMSITILSALLVLLASTKMLEYIWVCLIPVALFYFLDSYYLHLEQQFRERYNWVVEKHHDGGLEDKELYFIKPGNEKWPKALKSPSTWPVYFAKAILIGIVNVGVLCWPPTCASDDKKEVALRPKATPAAQLQVEVKPPVPSEPEKSVNMGKEKSPELPDS